MGTFEDIKNIIHNHKVIKNFNSELSEILIFLKDQDKVFFVTEEIKKFFKHPYNGLCIIEDTDNHLRINIMCDKTKFNLWFENSPEGIYVSAKYINEDKKESQMIGDLETLFQSLSVAQGYKEMEEVLASTKTAILDSCHMTGDFNHPVYIDDGQVIMKFSNKSVCFYTCLLKTSYGVIPTVHIVPVIDTFEHVHYSTNNEHVIIIGYNKTDTESVIISKLITSVYRQGYIKVEIINEIPKFQLRDDHIVSIDLIKNKITISKNGELVIAQSLEHEISRHQQAPITQKKVLSLTEMFSWLQCTTKDQDIKDLVDSVNKNDLQSVNITGTFSKLLYKGKESIILRFDTDEIITYATFSNTDTNIIVDVSVFDYCELFEYAPIKDTHNGFIKILIGKNNPQNNEAIIYELEVRMSCGTNRIVLQFTIPEFQLTENHFVSRVYNDVQEVHIFEVEQVNLIMTWSQEKGLQNLTSCPAPVPSTPVDITIASRSDLIEPSVPPSIATPISPVEEERKVFKNTVNLIVYLDTEMKAGKKFNLWDIHAVIGTKCDEPLKEFQFIKFVYRLQKKALMCFQSTSETKLFQIETIDSGIELTDVTQDSLCRTKVDCCDEAPHIICKEDDKIGTSTSVVPNDSSAKFKEARLSHMKAAYLAHAHNKPTLIELMDIISAQYTFKCTKEDFMCLVHRPPIQELFRINNTLFVILLENNTMFLISITLGDNNRFIIDLESARESDKFKFIGKLKDGCVYFINRTHKQGVLTTIRPVDSCLFQKKSEQVVDYEIISDRIDHVSNNVFENDIKEMILMSMASSVSSRKPCSNGNVIFNQLRNEGKLRTELLHSVISQFLCNDRSEIIEDLNTPIFAKIRERDVLVIYNTKTDIEMYQIMVDECNQLTVNRFLMASGSRLYPLIEVFGKYYGLHKPNTMIAGYSVVEFDLATWQPEQIFHSVGLIWGNDANFNPENISKNYHIISLDTRHVVSIKLNAYKQLCLKFDKNKTIRGTYTVGPLS
ncbi:MAG: hypothetical protein GY804_08505 [Alphaproteobacteria bacterium]|nr:hypothetical protein [Alphaproteobacteria bacterium]